MSLIHLEKLKKLMPPLNPPPENMVDWVMAEEVFGVPFPNDFKEFVHTYGNVIWCDLFRAIYPDTESRRACEKSKEDTFETLSHVFSGRLYDADGNVADLQPYPTPGGLLPCLTDTNSDFICWRTVGHPDQWTVVKYSVGNILMLPCDLTQLICDWIEQIPPADQVWGAYFLEPKKYGIAR